MITLTQLEGRRTATGMTIEEAIDTLVQHENTVDLRFTTKPGGIVRTSIGPLVRITHYDISDDAMGLIESYYTITETQEGTSS